MFGRKNPLKELEGNEYKLAREEGFAQGKRTGWFISALVGIPGIALAVIAGIASGGVAIALLPLAALVGSLVVGAVAQMYSDRRNSKRAANLLLAQRELLDQKKEDDGQSASPDTPEQSNAKGQGQPTPAAGQPAKGAAPSNAAPSQPFTPQPAAMAPPQPMPPQGYAPPMAQNYHGVATSPQTAPGTVMGRHTANLAQRGGAPMPAYSPGRP